MLRAAVGRDILDYQQLSGYLRAYAKPRDRISALLRTGELIRVRKGLYVFGENERRNPICRELLANLIYGPSYVSLDYALAYHGLIPEDVAVVTSVTTGARRRFSTPFGLFTYRHLPVQRYAAGAAQIQAGDDLFLIATPEKALADKVWADKRLSPRSASDIRKYLLEDLRMDAGRLVQLDDRRLRAVTEAYATRKILLLCRCIEQLKERSRE